MPDTNHKDQHNLLSYKKGSNEISKATKAFETLNYINQNKGNGKPHKDF